MVTNNFKQAMKLILANKNNRNSGGLEIKDTTGATKYLMCISGWPSGSGVATSVIINSNNNPGIWVGSGNAEPAATDYNLGNRITSGASGTVSFPNNSGVDENGNPQLKMAVTITNTGSANITIAEIGFFQQVNAHSSASGSSGSSTLVMLDRAVLNTPVTIPAGESAAITYTLKTVIA